MQGWVHFTNTCYCALLRDPQLLLQVQVFGPRPRLNGRVHSSIHEYIHARRLPCNPYCFLLRFPNLERLRPGPQLTVYDNSSLKNLGRTVV
jgi:hypothetical protein